MNQSPIQNLKSLKLSYITNTWDDEVELQTLRHAVVFTNTNGCLLVRVKFFLSCASYIFLFGTSFIPFFLSTPLFWDNSPLTYRTFSFSFRHAFYCH